jgi:hypothetical protein
VRLIKVDLEKPYPLASEVDPAVRLEMICIMHAHARTRYQALYLDGSAANLRFLQSPDVDSIFCDGKSRMASAHYEFPEDRNVFLCHLVNLVSDTSLRQPLTQAA